MSCGTGRYGVSMVYVWIMPLGYAFGLFLWIMPLECGFDQKGTVAL